MRIIALTAIVIAAALATPALASASTYCVGTPGGTCDVSKPGTAAGLQQALTAAADSAGGDVVRIAPGTYTGNFAYWSSNELDIQGSGNPTVIEGTGTDPALLVNASGSASVVSDLHVRMADVSDPDAATGLRIGSALAQSVRVTNPDDSPGAAVQLMPGGYLYGSTVLASRATGVAEHVGGVHEVRDSFIAGALGVSAEPGSSWTVQNVQIAAKYTGVATAGSMTLRNSVVRVAGGTINEGATSALYKLGSGVLSADHVTIQTAPNVTYGASVVSAPGGTATLDMKNSIMAGTVTASSFARDATGGGSANIVLGHSRFAPPAQSFVDAGKGSGVLQQTPAGTNTSADPHFVDPLVTFESPTVDLRLRHDSPLIDKGTPGGVQGTDLAGEPRLANGDGAGDPVRDMGAYEYQRRAPFAAIAAPAAGPFTVGAQVAFSAQGSRDPDAGDTLAYAWSFGDGAGADGASPSHAYESPGQRTATLTVTDPTGQTATATTALLVEGPPAGPAPDPAADPTPDPAPDPGAADAHAPTISAVSVSRGKRVRFTLSEAAHLRFAIARRSDRRWVRLRSLAREGTAGRNSIRLRTRSLAPGRYRLTLAATDTAGNRSAARRLAFRIVRTS